MTSQAGIKRKRGRKCIERYLETSQLKLKVLRENLRVNAKDFTPESLLKERNRISALESRVNKRRIEDGLKAVRSKVTSTIIKLDELLDEENKKRIVAFYTKSNKPGKRRKTLSEAILDHLGISESDKNGETDNLNKDE